MTQKMFSLVFVIVAMTVSEMYLPARPDDSVAYPTGYRKWAHVRSALVGPTSKLFQSYGGLHHIYANEKAVEGYQTGKFPDGSVIVFDLLETKEQAGVTTEGARRFIDMMVKDSKRYATTGGWEYERFAGDSQTERALSAQAKLDCYKCHAGQKDRDFVFSTLRK